MNSPIPAPQATPEIIEVCPQCRKIPDLCVCASIQPIQSRRHILILQHPQEPDEALGSARLAHLALPNSTLKIGLSWANLKKALGREAQSQRWAVLHLGSGLKSDPQNNPRSKAPSSKNALQFVTKQGLPVDVGSEDIDGLVILDGTWSQAKTLWWRNAWLLKLRRAILQPQRPSLYKELRREPRRECLSTIESIAEALDALGEAPEAGQKLRGLFGELLEKQRARVKKPQS